MTTFHPPGFLRPAVPPRQAEGGGVTPRPAGTAVEFESTTCLLCGQAGSDVVMTAADVMTDKRRYSIVQCSSCRLAYTNPRPTPATIGYCYPDEYECHDVAANWDQRRRARIRRQVTRSILRAYHGYPGPRLTLPERIEAWLGRHWIRRTSHRCAWIPFRGQGRLLDFGCGAGSFLRTMADLGWQVSGVDVSTRVAAKVQGELGIPVHVGSLPHPDLRASSFDVITMWASLEHVHGPREVVRAAKELLAPGGSLVVAVPNFASWSRWRFGEHWYGIQLPRHLTHFTPGSLRSLLESEGLRVERVQTVAMDGWVRRSSRDASAAGNASAWSRAASWKPLATLLAGLAEWRDQGDNLVAYASRV